MPIRMTGMVSGLDTDSIVKELVSAYSTKKEKYEKEQTKLGWKQEIWKSLNKEVNSFYKSVGNLRFDSGYNTKKTTSSDSTKATVSASGNATVGTQKLHVLSTAQSGYLTGLRLRQQPTRKLLRLQSFRIWVLQQMKLPLMWDRQIILHPEPQNRSK